MRYWDNAVFASGVSASDVSVTDIVSGSSTPWPFRRFDSGSGVTPFVQLDDENAKKLAAQVWAMMFEFPVMIPCWHCDCMNAVTNGACIHCGAPMGKAHKEVVRK